MSQLDALEQECVARGAPIWDGRRRATGRSARLTFESELLARLSALQGGQSEPEAPLDPDQEEDPGEGPSGTPSGGASGSGGTQPPGGLGVFPGGGAFDSRRYPGRHEEDECCLCWRFLCTDERNCDCCYCPHEEDEPCQCFHCSCSENPNLRCCCCSCANNPHCKCCCCSYENTECQCYESRCCTYVPNPYRTRHRNEIVYGYPKRRTRSNTSVITLEKDASGHAFIDQLTCPLCKELFLHPFMLPCNHCLCEKCIKSSQERAEVIENFFIITCPICSKAHCLPFSNKIQLRMNYLRARLARRYMRRFGFLKWRFDKSKIPIYCQVCIERRHAVKRCVTCQLNYCNVCLTEYHMDVTTQNHIFTKVSYEVWEEKNCLLHPDALLSRYCLDDHELVCDYCKESWHNDHEVVALPMACSKQSAELFSTIAKFKKVRYVIDNDLMEILVLKNNFKSYKEAKRREIRDGFFRLRNIFHEREKEMMEAVENLEIQKQRKLIEYANYTTQKIAQMDSLMQYSKEALKESSQIAFLQSSNCLIGELEDIIENVYQPSPYLKEDPIKHLKVNFEEIAETLQTLFPSIKRKMEADKSTKHPYSGSSDIMIPRYFSNTQVKSLSPSRSQSLSTLTSQSEENPVEVERSNSSPPTNFRGRGLYAFWDASLDSSKNERNYQTQSPYFEPEALEESTTVPGLVVIYQTLVYPTAAKIYWTCPTENVDSFEIAYYEVLEAAADDLVRTKLIEVITGIGQQNLEIRNLSPNTEYIFKVRAVNAQGPGQWSDVCKVTTQDARTRAKARWGLLRNIQTAFRK
ncbi:tripartite motif-containing protein 42 [Heteronotia binoei]|uniref:tripartite motif-containing protein 42 n=1 Tax=Heteronotia binoei TaxID=13085 RepID=UPI00292FADC4|nr:tripartite motif-containing protein 42 [Heteronotia binoei]